MSKTSQKTSLNRKDHLIPGQGLKNGQPSPAAKSAGRERKRQAKRMMDMVMKYQEMTKSELEAMSTNKDLTVLELLMIKYVVSGMKDNRMLLDMIDRHISKAPTQMEISGEEGGPIDNKLTIEIISKSQEIDK